MRAESRAPNYFITADANLDAADPVAGIAVIEAGSLFSDGRRGKVFSGDRASKGVNNSDAVIDAVTAGSGVAVIGLTVDPDAISSDLERPVQKGVSPSLANNGYDDNGYLPSSGSFHRDSEDDITTGAIRVAADQVTTEWSMEYQDVQGCFLMHELVYILVCRKCIYDKISDEELECCPICNIDLGCVPLEKLRTKSVARKAAALRGSGFSIEKSIKKEEDSVGERPESSSSPETLNTLTQNIRQSSPSAEPSIHSTLNKETENGAESWEGKFDLWKPLNCLVEVANRTKSLKFNSQGSVVKSEPMHAPDGESQVRKTKVKEHGCRSKVKDEKRSSILVPVESVKPKKLCRIRRRRAAAFGELGISPQAVLNAVNNHERRTGSIWFSLVASEDQEGDAPLPQISSSFLRIKSMKL